MANVYKNALRDVKNTDSAAERFSRGDACLDRGDFDSAFANYNEATRLSEVDEIIADCDETLRFCPYDSITYIERGIARSKRGDHDSAIDDFNEAILLAPNDSIAFINRGRTHSIMDDYDSAIADYTEAIRLDPNNTTAYCLRGNVAARKSIALNAKECLDDASAFFSSNRGIYSDDTTDGTVYFDDIVYYLDEHDIDVAIADYASDAMDCFDDDGAYYPNKRDIDSAIADYTEAIRLDPDCAPAYYSRAVAYKRRGDVDLSDADFLELSRIRNEEIIEQ